jgi:peptidoglycan/xylan/chitin deacetylase (PgdA/CDA1 family)
MLIELVGGAAGAVAGCMAYGVRSRSSTLFADSRWRGAPDRPAIALTFDDGPSESTPQLLELLARENVRATFFECGTNVRRLPGVAAEAARAGHEIGNHSDTHAPLYLRSTAFMHQELARAQEAIEAATGRRPRLFRPPFGARWIGLGGVQRRLGLLGVMWTAIGLDWKLTAGCIVERLLGAARNGAILCLHDGRGVDAAPDVRESLAAVREIVPALRERGYRFETVSEILCPTN